MLFTPEAEQGKPLSPALLKDIRDPSTLWQARDLYESGKIAFHIPGLLDINSNDYIDITTIDGGVRRSLRSVPWAKDMSGSDDLVRYGARASCGSFRRKRDHESDFEWIIYQLSRAEIEITRFAPIASPSLAETLKPLRLCLEMK
jgi:hypothetical protein